MKSQSLFLPYHAMAKTHPASRLIVPSVPRSFSNSLTSLRTSLRDQNRNSTASFDPPVQSEEAALGPATAALELEQKSLRKAAVARYEMKKRENQPDYYDRNKSCT